MKDDTEAYQLQVRGPLHHLVYYTDFITDER